MARAVAALVTVIAIATAACSADEPERRDAAVAACRSVRASIAGERLDPERTFRFLDRAVAQAHRAAEGDARYQPLATAIEDFRRTLQAPSTYTDAARFTLAARSTKRQCLDQVDVDIGVAG